MNRCPSGVCLADDQSFMGPPPTNTISDGILATEDGKLTHSHIAELSEAFRMLLYCGNAASGHHSAVMNAVDPSATMTATVGAMVHQHPQQSEGGNSPKSGASPPTSSVVSPGATLGAHTGQGNATVVNSVTSDQLSAILTSLGVAHTHLPSATAQEKPTSVPGSPSLKRGQSFRGAVGEQTDAVTSTIHIIDDNFDGDISFTDFLQLMLRRADLSDIEQMKLAFKYFDKSGSGTVSTNQFVEMFATMGEQSSPEEIDEMLAFADPEGTGRIDYAAFLSNLAYGS